MNFKLESISLEDSVTLYWNKGLDMIVLENYLYIYIIFHSKYQCLYLKYSTDILKYNTKVVSKALSVTCLKPVTFCDICAETLLKRKGNVRFAIILQCYVYFSKHTNDMKFLLKYYWLVNSQYNVTLWSASMITVDLFNTDTFQMKSFNKYNPSKLSILKLKIDKIFKYD